jgi:CubicO group peptidase (beta-lactamase class C family)
VSTTRSRSDVQTAVERAVQRALERGEVGLGVAVYHHGDLVADAFGGIADEQTGRAVDADTVFWIASVSKALTATALHIQAERGLVDYARPVAHYWPEFGVHGKDRATVLDALSHRAGVPIFPLDATPELICDYEWVAGRIAGSHPIYEPGTRNAYHSFTFGWPVGEVVRRTDPKGRSLRDFVHEELFEPLGADELWFGIPEEVEPRVTRAYNRPAPGPAGYGHDVLTPVPPAVATSAEVFNRPDVHRACNPSAGAIGNARSVARVFAMLAGGGELDGVRLLSEDRVRLLAAPRPYGWDLVLGDGCRVSIGGYWIPHADGNSAPMGKGLQILGHTGAAGNIAWCDVEHRLAVAITTNRMGSGRRSVDENPLVDIGDSIRGALGIS